MKPIGRYLLILIVVMGLWNTLIIKPLKIFAVFLHELGYSLMAFVFGYGIQGFKVNFDESGYALVMAKDWFSAFMIANGGYLGSVLFALLILYLKRTGFKKFILGSLAIIFLVVSLKYSGFSFTLLYSAVFAIVVLLLYMAQNERLNDWVIDIIGISSAAYAVYDTFVDTILLQVNLYLDILKGWQSQPMTDAEQLARLTHIPAIVWGIIWMGIALFSVYALLLKAPGTKSPVFKGSGKGKKFKS